MASTLELLTINNADRIMQIPVDFTTSYPELSYFSASIVPEINFNAAIAVPSVGQGGFRDPYQGIERAHPDIVLKPVSCKLFDGSWDADTGAARGYHRGEEEYYNLIRQTAMLGTLSKICRQIWWGLDENSGGFKGITQSISAYTPKVGTKTPGCEHVFAVKTGEPYTQLAWGKNGTIEVKPMFQNTHTEFVGGKAKKYDTMGETINAWCGLQVGSEFSFGVCYHPSWSNDNVAPGNVFNDNMLYTLLSQFHVDFAPTAFFMSRKSAAALRASRTATNPTGAPAPVPDSVAGIPIYITESLTIGGPKVAFPDDEPTGTTP